MLCIIGTSGSFAANESQLEGGGDGSPGRGGGVVPTVEEILKKATSLPPCPSPTPASWYVCSISYGSDGVAGGRVVHYKIIPVSSPVPRIGTVGNYKNL